MQPEIDRSVTKTRSVKDVKRPKLQKCEDQTTHSNRLYTRRRLLHSAGGAVEERNVQDLRK